MSQSMFDVISGVIISDKLLGVDVTRVSLFHSHLEPLWALDPKAIADQVRLYL